MPDVGMSPDCSLAITFSQTSGLAPGLVTSSVSSVSPAVRSFWLWQVTQYLSSTARGLTVGGVSAPRSARASSRPHSDAATHNDRVRDVPLDICSLFALRGRTSDALPDKGSIHQGPWHEPDH